MRAIYDNQPSKLEAVGNGAYRYRYAINKVMTEAHEGEESREQWQCEEVIVWSPITANKITEAVIVDKWDNNQEAKLVNEYNGVALGIYGETRSVEAKRKVDAYRDYLSQRASLKAIVDKDCEELGIE